jgi:hypothetical protein
MYIAVSQNDHYNKISCIFKHNSEKLENKGLKTILTIAYNIKHPGTHLTNRYSTPTLKVTDTAKIKVEISGLKNSVLE